MSSSPHIYIYSPSGAVRDRVGFRRAVKRLQALGAQVEIDPAALSSWQRFAGDDEARLAAITRAASSGADVALITRGGYGLTRILPQLPSRAIARSVQRGTRWVGMSDFTALQCAVLAATGASTWAGPALGDDFGGEAAPDDIMQACFEDVLQGRSEGSGWTLPAAEAGDFETPASVLWGGNLAILAGLAGTPYLPDVPRGILFVEDVHEHPYRIERMLTQLLHAGVLARQRAILLGQFSRYQLTPHDKGFRLASVVAWLRQQIKCPIYTGLPFGHVPTKVLLPVGYKSRLMVAGREALLYWGA